MIRLLSLRRVVHQCQCRWMSTSTSSRKEIEGLEFTFDENEARVYFSEWLKSLWFAPGGWRETTRDEKITVLQRYLPFWNNSLHGSVTGSIRLDVLHTEQRGKTFAHQRSESYSVPMSLTDLSLVDVNISAAQTFDRYHLNELNLRFASKRIVRLSPREDLVDQWTVDRQTAFQIGWDLNLIPLIQQRLIQQSEKMYPGYSTSHVHSFHWKIHRHDQRLLYYPIYVIEYDYGGKREDGGSRFTCLIDGQTGRVKGDRQYSFLKVTLTSLFAFYPLSLMSLLSVGSLIDPSIGLTLASLLSFSHSIPLALILSPLIGLFAKNSPRLYRQRINQQQWNNYRSNSTQFTYDFTNDFNQQYRSYQQQQQQRKQEEKKKTKRDESMDLYRLLSVDRQATEKEIKRAYLIKAKELHPDRNPNDRHAEEAFKRVNQAYAILSDQAKRKEYDQHGYEAVKYQ